MQAKLITFGTVFASWGAAAFSGQSETSTCTPILCLFCSHLCSLISVVSQSLACRAELVFPCLP